MFRAATPRSSNTFFSPNAEYHSTLSPLRNSNPLTILITDDNEGNRKTAALLFTRLLGKQHTIIEAEDGNDAVHKVVAKMHSDQKNFDIILMDYHMPNMLGDEATKNIRDLEKNYNIERSTILTWSTDFQLENKGPYYSGADGVLQKPMTKVDLENCFKNLPVLFNLNSCKAQSGILQTPRLHVMPV